MIFAYLSPEPMLQDPKWVRDEASDGFSAPTYAYARNNPLRYTDPTGLFVGAGLLQCYSDCVKESLLNDEVVNSSHLLFPFGMAAGSDTCQEVAGETVVDLLRNPRVPEDRLTSAQQRGLSTVAGLFRVVRGTAVGAAAVSIGVQASCWAFCRADFTTGPYRAPGDANGASPEDGIWRIRRPGWR